MSFNNPVLYDMYEKQKLIEIKMAIYKSFTDNDEMSKSLCMKKYLGWTDEEIHENYMGLIKDKQYAAIADYFADKISDDNPPVDFKSPIKLKTDIENAEKSIGGESSTISDDTSEITGEDNTGNQEAESEEEPVEEPTAKEAETPTFGLG